MNNKKVLLILAIIMAVLIGACVFVFTYDFSQTGVDESVSSEDVIYVYEHPEDVKIIEIDVKADGEGYGFVLKGENEWAMKNIPDEECESQTVSFLESSLKSITVNEIVAENAVDLSPYGLDREEKLVTFKTDKGVQKTMICGNKTPVGNYYYFKDKETPVVYTVSGSVYSSLFKPMHSYRNTKIVRIALENLNRITITGGVEKIDILKAEETADNNAISTYKLTSPVKADVDDAKLAESVISLIEKIAFKNIVSDSASFADYGLNNPKAQLYIENEAGEKQSFKFSDYTKDKVYCSINNMPTVFEVTVDKALFEVEYFNLLNRFINLMNIDDCKSIEIKTDKGVNVLEIKSKKEGEYTYLVNGKECEEKNFKSNYYQPVIGLMGTSFVTDAVYGKPYASFVFTSNDGLITTVDYVEYNDRNLAVFKNGKCEFIILKKNVDEVLSAFEK